MMKIQEGPAFGAAIIGCGIGYLLIRSGQPIWLGVLAGFVISALDYALLVFLKSKGIGK